MKKDHFEWAPGAEGVAWDAVCLILNSGHPHRSERVTYTCSRNESKDNTELLLYKYSLKPVIKEGICKKE